MDEACETIVDKANEENLVENNDLSGEITKTEKDAKDDLKDSESAVKDSEKEEQSEEYDPKSVETIGDKTNEENLVENNDLSAEITKSEKDANDDLKDSESAVKGSEDVEKEEQSEEYDPKNVETIVGKTNEENLVENNDLSGEITKTEKDAKDDLKDPESAAQDSESVEKEEQSEEYDPKNVHYEGDVAVYTEPKSGYQFVWDKEKSEWKAKPKSDPVYSFEDDTHTYTDTDGTQYFWDKSKNAWFPKINDDFMAKYQLNYGFVDNSSEKATDVPKPESIVKPKPVPVEEKGMKRKPSEPSWFEVDETQNTKVYVSNLPLNITEDEFVELMQKCGIIKRDFESNKLKVKLYVEHGSNEMKGDGLCTYVRTESVDLALKLLDGSDFKDKKIKVERAKFQLKGAYNPSLKPKSKKRKEKQKLKRMQEKLFDWRPEKVVGERGKHEKSVILRNVFESKMFDENVGLILELQDDLRKEGAKCGTVRKVIIFDRHPEGIAQINFTDPEEADACVELLNGRTFNQRQITAELWDGKTKFKIAETDAEISQRIDKWDEFLEGGDATKT